MQPVLVLTSKKQITSFLSKQQRTQGGKKIFVTQKSHTEHCMQLHIKTYLENVHLRSLLDIPVTPDYLIPRL